MARAWVLLVACSLAACGLSADSAAATNPMLDRWCHSHPCGWDVSGDVEQVGTWHPTDYAAELVSDDASLSQWRAELDSSSMARCFQFSLMAHIDAASQAFFELDFLNDGVIDFSARIPESDWQVRTFTVATPTWYEGVRFIVRKAGPGQVIVAELDVALSRFCSATPLELNARPTGAVCEVDGQCTSGSCPIAPGAHQGKCD